MPDLPTIKRLDLETIWDAEPPKMDFVLPGLLASTVGNVVAAGGTGKTLLMLATALGIAVGRDIGDVWGEDPRQGRAVFLSLEDPDVVLHARLHAFLRHLSAEERQLASAKFDVLSYAGHGLSLATTDRNGSAVTKWYAAMETFLTAAAPRLCVIDTLNRALGGISENDAGAMGWIIGQLESLARKVGCAIVICHHVSKQALAMSSAGEAHAARGSSVITDNARWQCNLWVPGAKDLGFGKMSEVERQTFVRLAIAKKNYGPPLATRLLRRGDEGVLSYHGEIALPPPRGKTMAQRSASRPVCFGAQQ